MTSVHLSSRGPNRDGSLSISIEFLYMRKRWPKLICKVNQKQWDAKRGRVRPGTENWVEINEMLDERMMDAKRFIIECQKKNIDADPRIFFKRISGKTICDLINARAEKFLQADSYGTWKKARGVANKIEKAGMNIDAAKLTIDWVKDYDTYMDKVKRNQPSTRAKDLKEVSAALNDAGLPNPVSTYRKPSNKSSKSKLTLHEIEKIRTVELTDPFHHTSRLAWLFALYGRGIRAFDLLTLRWVNVDSGRLKYAMGKNRKPQDVEITIPMQWVLDQLPRKGEYIFDVMTRPYSQWEDRSEENKKLRLRYWECVNSFRHDVNKALEEIAKLAGVNKKITMHVARHTFSYAALKKGIGLADLQGLLDHGSIQTTRTYAEVLLEADEKDDIVRGVF